MSTIEEIEKVLNDKTLKAKVKTEIISEALINKELSIIELIGFAKKSKDPIKATCIESIEYASNSAPELVSDKALQFCIDCLSEKAPRIKWESARVIANTIHLNKELINSATEKLLENTNHPGTVVRWSSAFALSKILLLKTDLNHDLKFAIEAIINQEEKSSIKKIYLETLKKIK